MVNLFFILLHLYLVGILYFYHLILVVLFDLIDFLLYVSDNGLQVLFDGMIKVEIDGRKVFVKYGGDIDGVNRLGEFDDNGSD